MYYISTNDFHGCTSESLVNLDQVAVIEKEDFDYGNNCRIVFCYGVSARKRWAFDKKTNRDAAFKEIQDLLSQYVTYNYTIY